MPTITNPEVLKAIALGFLVTDKNKGAGLREAGYSMSYSRSAKGLKLYERKDLLAEIRKQQLALLKKTGYSKEQATQDLMDDRQLARECKQPSAAISANTALIRLYGMEQMPGSDATVIIISPPAQISKSKSVENRVIDSNGGNIGKALESNNDDS